MARVKRAATLAKERKRAKQEIKDFIPAGGTFKPIADEGIEIASTSGAARKKRARVTKMNWNGGPSKGVRTSFRNKGAGVHDDLAGGQKQGGACFLIYRENDSFTSFVPDSIQKDPERMA